MTVVGTIHRAILLGCCVLATAIWTWRRFFATGRSDTLLVLGAAGVFGGLPVSLLTLYKKEWSPYTAPVYAVFEGLFLGAASARLEAQFPGIVLEGVGFTFVTFFSLLIAYRSRLFRIGEHYGRIIITSLTGFVLVRLVAAVLLMNTHIPIPLLSGHPGSIVSDLIFTALAMLTLIADLEFISHAADREAPKYLEWYGGYALTFTLVSLYVQILSLLSKVSGAGTRENAS
jgi:uncharacterized YccA/Bax inhibitor family protein